MTDSVMACPNCGEECGRDSVDNGVAVLYGPWGCYCGWSESADYNVLTGPRLDEHGYQVDQWGGLTPPQVMESELGR